jgi:sensor domain CHASE-containing protein
MLLIVVAILVAILMLMGTCGQAVLGLSADVQVTQTALAAGQQWMANSMRLWPQDEHQLCTQSACWNMLLWC